MISCLFTSSDSIRIQSISRRSNIPHLIHVILRLAPWSSVQHCRPSVAHTCQGHCRVCIHIPIRPPRSSTCAHIMTRLHIPTSVALDHPSDHSGKGRTLAQLDSINAKQSCSIDGVAWPAYSDNKAHEADAAIGHVQIMRVFLQTACIWDRRLAEGIPLDLSISHCGAAAVCVGQDTGSFDPGLVLDWVKNGQSEPGTRGILYGNSIFVFCKSCRFSLNPWPRVPFLNEIGCV